MSAPDIKLPDAIRPLDGRFGSGPSKVPHDAVAALADAAPGYLGTSHRKDGVRSVVGRIRRGLAELFSLPDGYEVLIGNGGSTLFWDAASFGLVEKCSTHLVIGEFSSKFAAVTRAAPHLDDPQVCETAPGLRPELPDRVVGDVYAYPHNETSTGVMIPVHRPDRSDALVVVDGTSGASGMRVDATAFDVYYFAPQKCFASDGGLWLALCSPRAVERIEQLHASGRWVPASLDLMIAVENSRLDQTYNTPALATIFLLDHQLQWMLANGGLEFAAGRCDTSAGIVYGWAEQHPHATPFVADAVARSHVTATIDFDDTVDASAVAAVLRANGVLDVDPYRKLGRNQLRIALFPSIDADDVERLTHAIDFVIEALRAEVQRMLLLHEVHTVAGRHEDAFEGAFRNGWMPTLAKDDDARLLYFLRLAHGTGRAYHTVTITALRDGAAYERLATRVQRGDLRSWASDLDLLRHEVQGKLLLPVDWSPMQDLDLTAVPTDGREHDPVLYMEDSAWPHESMLDTYLDKARTHYAPSLEERTARSLLTLLGVFQAALGAPRRREVVLWQRVDFPDRLPALFTRELPVHVKGPGTWMHDALEVRDDWESRLLRSAAWSPL